MSTISAREYEARISALERQCAALATETNNQRQREHETRGEPDRYIRQLEHQNDSLAAEVDRQRPVVEAAQSWAKMSYGEVDMVIIRENKLRDAVDEYEATRKQITAT